MSACRYGVITSNKSTNLCRYSALKKQIYLLEKSQTPRFTHDDVHDRDDLEAHERSALIGGDSPTDRVFRHLLDLELKKVCDFYMVQEQKELEELSELEKLVKLKDEESFSGADRQYMNTGGDFDDDDEDEDEDTRMRGNSRSRERHSTRGSLGRRRTKSDARPYGTARTYVKSRSHCKHLDETSASCAVAISKSAGRSKNCC